MKTPYPYQQEAIEHFTSAALTGHILADACGLGKTLTAIEVAKNLRTSPKWRTLVICPPHLVAQWVDEIKSQDPDTPVLVADARPYNFTHIHGWIITTYYELYRPYFLEALCNFIWDLVILDEAHRIKNRRTVMAKYTKAIPLMHSLLLTATPMDEKPEDIWSLLNFIQPDRFRGFHAFTLQHLETEDDYFRGKVIVGPKDPEKFASLISPYMIRRTKEEVLPDLPPRIDVLARVPMEAEQQGLYDAIKESDDVVVGVQDQELVIINVLSLITKLQQVATFPKLLGLQALSAKVGWLKAFLEDHPEPVVIFSRFRGAVLHLAKAIGGDYIVGGDRSPSFDENKFTRLFGTIDAMGEGLNLQRADVAVFLDGHWSTLKMTHAFDRIHRVNITSPKTVYMLHSCREDRMVYEAVRRKWDEAMLVYKYLGDNDVD